MGVHINRATPFWFIFLKGFFLCSFALNTDRDKWVTILFNRTRFDHFFKSA